MCRLGPTKEYTVNMKHKKQIIDSLGRESFTSWHEYHSMRLQESARVPEQLPLSAKCSNEFDYSS